MSFLNRTVTLAVISTLVSLSALAQQAAKYSPTDGDYIAHNFKFIIRVPGPNRNPLGGPRNCKPKLRAR